MTTLHLTKSINRSPLRLAFLLIPFVFVCFGLSPAVRAVVPAPDGGYPGANTAEGTNALFSLYPGNHNTADGFAALSRTTTGQHNTATGDEALGSNTTGSFNTADGARRMRWKTIRASARWP